MKRMNRKQLIDALAKQADRELREMLGVWLSDNDQFSRIIREGKQSIKCEVDYYTYEYGAMTGDSFTVMVDPSGVTK